MKQIFHIFAKDVRRFLPEILIVLALWAVIASNPSYWLGFNSQLSSGGIAASEKPFDVFDLLFSIDAFAWIFLVSRVIQAERLAGDNQFWITRPYDWKKLLMAKVLFIVTFIYLPVIATYIIQGFPTRLFSNHMVAISVLEGYGSFSLQISILLLPAAALATVTTNIARMLGGVFCAFVCILVLLMLRSAQRPDSFASVLSGIICSLVFIVLCCAVILLQYSRRKTRLSLSLLISIPVLVFAIQIITPELFPPDSSQPPPATVSRPK